MLGKFYHRPPGGESWADVILRLRSMLNTINLHYSDKRVLVVCHQVVVLCMRYILEELEEGEILAIDKQAEVLNCGICAYDFEPDAEGLCAPELVAVEPRRPARGRRRRQDRRAGRDGGRAVKTPKALTRPALRAFPLPASGRTTGKDGHGRLLIVAGSRQVPGAALLCAMAALRTGAGKVRVATVASVAPGIALQMPEADGRRRLPKAATAVAPGHRFARSKSKLQPMDAVVAGPGIREGSGRRDRSPRPCSTSGRPLALDAGLLHDLQPLARDVAQGGDSARSCCRIRGEMASLLDCDEDEVEADRLGCARAAAEHYRRLRPRQGRGEPHRRARRPRLDLSRRRAGPWHRRQRRHARRNRRRLCSRAARTRSPRLLWGVLLHGEAGEVAVAKDRPGRVSSRAKSRTKSRRCSTR